MASHFRTGNKNLFLPDNFAGTFPKGFVAAVTSFYFDSFLPFHSNGNNPRMAT